MSAVPPTTTTRLVCGWSCRAASRVPLQSISHPHAGHVGGSTKSTPVFFSTDVKTIGTPGKSSSRWASRNRSAPTGPADDEVELDARVFEPQELEQLLLVPRLAGAVEIQELGVKGDGPR